MTFTPEEVPGMPETMAVLRELTEVPPEHTATLAAEILTRVTPAILAAAFADLADRPELTETFGPHLATYLDTVSNQIRERACQ